MSSWIEHGKRYVTYDGKETTPLFRTPVTSIYGDTFVYSGYIEGTTQMQNWNGCGDSARYGQTNLTLVDEIDGNEDEVSNDKINDLFDSDISFLFDVKSEVTAARARFSNTDLAHAMTEEFGEVIKALMDQKQKDKVSSAEIYKECVQAAAMAMRLAMEGDPCFPKFKPSEK